MRRATSTVLLCLLFLNACTHWATTSVPVEVALRAEDGPHHVRLLLRDSSQLELRFAMADREVITGQRGWPVQDLVVTPRDSVQALQFSRSNLKVWAIVIGGTFVTAAVGINPLNFLLEGK